MIEIPIIQKDMFIKIIIETFWYTLYSLYNNIYNTKAPYYIDNLMDRKKKRIHDTQIGFFQLKRWKYIVFFCLSSSSSTRECLITDWKAFIENRKDINTTWCGFVYTFLLFVYAEIPVHLQYKIMNCWTNRIDLFIWINQLNYLLRLICHKTFARANQLRENDIINKTSGNFLYAMTIVDKSKMMMIRFLF